MGVAAAGVLAACGGTPSPAAPTPTAARPGVTASQPPSPSPAPVPQRRIALFGDGLIDGNGLPDAQSLPYRLAAARPDTVFVDLGLGFESSDKVLTRDRDATELHLDAAVIWVGTYDAQAGNSAQQYAADMSRLLGDFKGVPVIVLPPVTLPRGRDAGPYVAALRQITPVADISGVMHSAGWQPDGRTLDAATDAALAATLAGLLPPLVQPDAPPQKRVALIGDSLSYGSELDPPQDLPSVLRSLRPDLDVIDTALGGQESGDALARVRQFRLLHADEAVIWLGTQDADDAVPVAQFRDNVTALVRALAPARTILVTPVPDYSADPRAFLPYAAATRQVAQQLGVQLVDLGDPPQSQYLSDGVHFDAAADAQVAAQEAKLL